MNTSKTNSETIVYRYKFTFGAGVQKEITVELDRETLTLIQGEDVTHPQWAQLDFFKCSNCTLDEQCNQFCPIAVNLAALIKHFANLVSYEEVDVLIETTERSYIKRTAVQKSVSSLIGIIMVTSGCPVMETLKPMVRFHLPFATAEETMFRVISMYLFAQYFLNKRGRNPDWELRNLTGIYNDIRIVNKCFCKRLTNINIKDSSINALVILDNFAKLVTFSINEDMLDEIEQLFSAYFERPNSKERQGG